MPRHIHIPNPHDWSTFLANASEIDNYLVSVNEIARTRSSPAPRALTLQMTNCCNLLWDFVISDGKPSILTLGSSLNALLLQGGQDEGLLVPPKDTPYRERTTGAPLRSTYTDTPFDKGTDFKPELIQEVLNQVQSHYSSLDEKIIDYLNRGFVPMDIQKPGAQFAWCIQYQFAWWRPFTGMNTLTGMFLTNALRLRWGMPIWLFEIKKDSWWSNLDEYSKFWRKKGSFYVLQKDFLPNLEKVGMPVQ